MQVALYHGTILTKDRSNLGGFRMILGGEVDCVTGTPPSPPAPS
jgi:hypothetical protein